jgi:hypothetical protein
VSLAKHAAVVVVVEVAEGREPAEDTVEPVLPRELAHVALDVLDLDAPGGGVGAGALEEERRRVEPRHTRALRGEAVRDPAVPAREVEQIHARLELE